MLMEGWKGEGVNIKKRKSRNNVTLNDNEGIGKGKEWIVRKGKANRPSPFPP